MQKVRKATQVVTRDLTYNEKMQLIQLLKKQQLLSTHLRAEHQT